MLTNDEYNNLWENHFEGINGLDGQTIPSYDLENGYLEAENMLEDYLDIFRGVNTRNERGNDGNEWYYEPFDIKKLISFKKTKDQSIFVKINLIKTNYEKN